MGDPVLQLKDALRGRDTFSVGDLSAYWESVNGVSNRNTIDWRIYDLKQKKVIQEIKNGLYTFAVKPVYAPEPDKQHIRLDKILRQNYRNVRYTIWNVGWLNEFSVHQFYHNNAIVEIEKDLQESLIDLLGQQGFFDITSYIGGNRMQLSGIKNPIYILPLISRAPLRKKIINKIAYPLPSLEKMLVDIYNEESIFYFLQGAEMKRIFENAISKYAINFTTLFAYAKRRNKEEKLKVEIRAALPSLPKNLTE